MIPASHSTVALRAATAADVPLILQFVRELAEYERAPEAAVATADDLVRYGFGAQPKYRVLLAFWNAEPAGFALYFNNFSTWMGKPGIYLEDLFVRPAHRKHGVGGALMRELARIALREDCYGIKWQVLDWNQLAIDFYDNLGSERQREWVSCRITPETSPNTAVSEVMREAFPEAAPARR